MAEIEYRQLSCREIGNDCDFQIRSRTEDELLRLGNEHLCEVHDVCVISSELKDKINHSIERVWCREGKCSNVSMEVEIPPW
jgi:predicted small metal-binding protein